MADEWVKLRAGLEHRLEAAMIADRVGITVSETVFRLYQLASWFSTHGHYGKLEGEPWLIDAFLKTPGFAAELLRVKWLVVHDNGVLTLRYFCTTSTARKSIGRKMRAKILSAGVCVACGQSDPQLEIDHKTPISRGGSCKEDNLQALCIECNRRKGRKTMEEFLG
jgi:hypothetical protein